MKKTGSGRIEKTEDFFVIVDTFFGNNLKMMLIFIIKLQKHTCSYNKNFAYSGEFTLYMLDIVYKIYFMVLPFVYIDLYDYVVRIFPFYISLFDLMLLIKICT